MNKQWGFISLVAVITISLVAVLMVITAVTYERNREESGRAMGNMNTNATNVAQTSEDINGEVDSNANTNANLISVEPYDTTATADSSNWKTITYQRGDHGITLQIPTDWSYSSYGVGANDGDRLFGVYGTSGEGEALTRVSMTAHYHKNESHDTLETWVNKYREYYSDYYAFSEPEHLIGLQDVYLLNTTSTKDEDSSNIWAFIARDDRIYEFSFSGSVNALAIKSGEINTILRSIQFIDTLPFVTIPAVANTKSFAANEGYALSVDWLDEPRLLNMTDPIVGSEESYEITRDYYEVGEITNGRYRGNRLVDVIQNEMGGPSLFRVVYDPTLLTFTYIEKYSDNLSYFNKPFIYDIGSTIPDLDWPSTIEIPHSDIGLTAETFQKVMLYTQFSSARSTFTDGAVGAVFFDQSSGCYFIVLKDGIVKRFYLDLNFISNNNDPEYAADSGGFIPTITWDDGSKNAEEYTFNEPTNACGSSGCMTVYTEEKIGGLDKLEVTGTTSTGDTVFEYIDTNDQTLKDAYESFYMPRGDEKPDYATFVASHPFFYWQDPFDHWVRFKRVDFLPAVECGKPVIYLYPEQTTAVNVQIAPTGGLSVSDPVYPTGGWNVIAHPDGRLEYEQQATYPYLFWEGYGMDYDVPEQGFTVSQDAVRPFLSDTLGKLGLNDQETADFMNFWVPKLQGSLYYFITFVDQQVFEQLAPLTVSPTPDSVIRVFMDYRPLDGPQSVEPLTIETPDRHGFTVVEWGGALH